MKRRHVIAGAGSIGLASLAGCLSTVGLDRHEASPAGVDRSVRDETGYEQTGVDELRVTEEVGASGLSEEITVVNYLTKHEKTVDMGPLGEQRGAVFMILSTPQIEIAGRTVNPIEEKSPNELVELVASNYGSISNTEHVSDDDVTILDQSATISTFAANAKFNGRDVDVNLHITTAVKTDDDLLVTIGVYPERAEDQEEPNIRSLAEGVVETAERTGDERNGSSESTGETSGDENESESGNESNSGGSSDNESDGEGDGFGI